MSIGAKFQVHSTRIVRETQTDCSEFSERPAVQKAFQIMLDYLAKHTVIHQGDRFLDVGAGGGQACRRFSETFGVSCWGISYNQDEIEAARLLGVKISRADMHDLPFEDAFFDIVYVSHVLEHSTAPAVALCEWKRTLKPDGKLILWGPIGRDFDGLSDGTAAYGCPEHIITPTLWQYRWLFRITGLRILHELDLPYQIVNDQQQKRYDRKKRFERFLGRFGLSLLPEKTPGTAVLFVLQHDPLSK